MRRVLKDYECSEIVKSAIRHDTYVNDLLKSVPHVHEAQEVAVGSRDRWIKEYLLGLQRRQVSVKERKDIHIGDLVLVTDEAAPRGLWPLGLITKTHSGRDGLHVVRSVTVRTKMATLDRPITRLIQLELA